MTKITSVIISHRHNGTVFHVAEVVCAQGVSASQIKSKAIQSYRRLARDFSTPVRATLTIGD